MTYGMVRLPDDAVLEHLVRASYGPELRVASVRHGYRSAIVKLVGDGRYVLKAMPDETGKADAAERAAAAGCVMARHGIPTATPVPTEERGFTVAKDGLVYLLYEEVDGETFEPDDLEAWRNAGDTLGRIHGLPRSALEGGAPLTTETERDRARGIVGKLVRGDVPGRLTEPLVRCLRDLETVTFCETRTAITHGDYRGQNVMMRGSKVQAVLDLDTAGPGDPVLDLAYATVFFPSVLRDGPPDPSRAHAFLAGYAASQGPPPRDAWRQAVSVALLRGLTLWCTIRYLRSEDAPRARLDRWIDAYLPLLGSPDWPDLPG